MTDTILTCQHVTKRFASRGRTTDVLSDVSLEIRRGGIAVIQGRSGTGKSTLLQILAGLDRPTTGRVEIAGRPLDALSAGELAALRRETMGFIFQNFNLISSWTAGQNVEAALIHTRLTRSQRAGQVRDMLDSLELSDRIDHLPSELSIGQQQRVAIARALIHVPSLVFADEPTGDVDPQTAQSILTCLTTLVRRNSTTLIVCTHGEFSPDAADQHYLLENGQVHPTTAE